MKKININDLKYSFWKNPKNWIALLYIIIPQFTIILCLINFISFNNIITNILSFIYISLYITSLFYSAKLYKFTFMFSLFYLIFNYNYNINYSQVFFTSLEVCKNNLCNSQWVDSEKKCFMYIQEDRIIEIVLDDTLKSNFILYYGGKYGFILYDKSKDESKDIFVENIEEKYILIHINDTLYTFHKISN